jgi:hypothetical protein
MKRIEITKELFSDQGWRITLTIRATTDTFQRTKITFELLNNDELEQLAQELIAAGEAL